MKISALNSTQRSIEIKRLIAIVENNVRKTEEKISHSPKLIKIEDLEEIEKIKNQNKK